MGVTLRYCDLCGNKLESANIDSPETLKIKDKIFCGACRPKVLAKLEAQKQKAQGTAPGSVAPQMAAPPPAAGGSAASAPRAGSRIPARVPARVPEEAGAARAAGGAATSSSPLSARRAGAPPEAAARTGAPARPSFQSRSRSPKSAAPEEVGERTVRVRAPSKMPILIAWAAIACGVIGAVVWYVNRDTPSDTTTTAIPVATAPKQPDTAERARKALDDARAYWEANPAEYRAAHDNFEKIRNTYWTECGKEAQELRDQVMRSWKSSADAALSNKLKQLNELQDADRFVDAVEACKELEPIIVDYSGFVWPEFAEFQKFAQEAKRQAEAHAYLAELLAKGKPYAEQDAADIAGEVLKQFKPEDYAGTKIHAVYERYKKQIESGGVKAWQEVQESAEAAALAKAKEKEEAERKRRLEEWNQELATRKWEAHIGRFDLYNWACRAGNWKLEVQGGIGVLAGNNQNNATSYAGLAHSHWQDYVVRYEAKIDKGSIKLSPRTAVIGGVDNGRVRDQSELIEITAEDLGAGKWVEITMEVQQESVRIYRADKSNTEPWKSLTGGDEYRLLPAGGLLIYLSDDTTATIRKLETKLISDTRQRKY